MGAIRVCRHEGTNHRDALRGLAPATRLTHDRHEGISPSRILVAGIIEFPAVFPRRDESKPDTSRRDYRVPCSVSTKGLVQAGDYSQGL